MAAPLRLPVSGVRLGIDRVAIARFNELLTQAHFMQRVFTDAEREHIARAAQPAATAAGLFAAKEAVSKVLGIGLGEAGLSNLEIRHTRRGAPVVVLCGRARERAALFGMISIAVSITHEQEVAMAVAMGAESNSFVPSRTGLHLNRELDLSLLRRDRQGYKTQYGRVAIIGGSRGMAGSVAMAAQAALRTGSGLVTAVVPAGIGEVVENKLLEGMVVGVADDGAGHFNLDSLPGILAVAEGCDAVAIGPGIGRTPDMKNLVSALLRHCAQRVVLDADGLNALQGDREVLREAAGTVALTPHEMEMSRLTGLPVEAVRADRVGVATLFAADTGTFVVLKGADTVITNGELHYLNATGNPGMATAGAGDVLAGMATSLLGYGYPVMTALRLGCYMHGLAGDLAKREVGEDGMIASDLIAQIPAVYRLLHAVRADQEKGEPDAEGSAG